MKFYILADRGTKVLGQSNFKYRAAEIAEYYPYDAFVAISVDDVEAILKRIQSSPDPRATCRIIAGELP